MFDGCVVIKLGRSYSSSFRPPPFFIFTHIFGEKIKGEEEGAGTELMHLLCVQIRKEGGEICVPYLD